MEKGNLEIMKSKTAHISYAYKSGTIYTYLYLLFLYYNRPQLTLLELLTELDYF